MSLAPPAWLAVKLLASTYFAATQHWYWLAVMAFALGLDCGCALAKHNIRR